jgi:hypothetical protein
VRSNLPACLSLSQLARGKDPLADAGADLSTIEAVVRPGETVPPDIPSIGLREALLCGCGFSFRQK